MKGLALVLAIANGLSLAQAEEVLGVFIFGRHGDRLAKPITSVQLAPNEGTAYLTPIGAQEEFNAGAFYRDRYYLSDSPYYIDGINQTYISQDLTAFAADSDLMYKSALAFMQGLYPPVNDVDISEATVPGSSMSNGTVEDSPLDGYQYVYVQGLSANSPDTIWSEGDDSCPTYTNASLAYPLSSEFQAMNQSSFDYYQSLASLLDGVFPKSELNFGYAFSIFDWMNVNSIHNQTFQDSLQSYPDALFRVRTLQDVYSKSINYNTSNPATVVGGKTLIGLILNQLNLTETTGLPRVSYLVGSYDIYYQLFGLLGLFDGNQTTDITFTGIEDYASTAVFELVENNSTKFVRFGFRNGSDESIPLNFYPILGSSSVEISYDEFQSTLNQSAIFNMGQWCSACQAYSNALCATYTPEYLNAAAHDFKVDDSSLSLADAGGIGAGVTIGVFALGAALLFLLFRGRRTSNHVSPELPVSRQSSNTVSSQPAKQEV